MARPRRNAAGRISLSLVRERQCAHRERLQIDNSNAPCQRQLSNCPFWLLSRICVVRGSLDADQSTASLVLHSCAWQHGNGHAGVRGPGGAGEERIGELAARAGLPTIYLYRAHVDAGGLVSYGPDLPDMSRRCGVYVGRILGGTKPAELPIERPARFELVVNLRTAKALGITIPEIVLVRSDEVIE